MANNSGSSSQGPSGTGSSGVAAAGQGLIEGMGELIDSLREAEKSGKDTAGPLKQMKDNMKKLADQSKKSKEGVVGLSKALLEMQRRSEDTRDASVALSHEYEGGMKIMSSSTKSALQDQIEAIKAAQKSLSQSGKGTSREATILSAKRSQLEMENFRDTRNFYAEKGKMLQRGEEGLLKRPMGVVMGVTNTAMKHGADAAEFLGEALGLETGAMMAAAAAIGVVLGVFTIFTSFMKKGAQGMMDMTKAGETTVSNLAAMRAASVFFHNRVAEAANQSNMTFEKMVGLLNLVNKESGRANDLEAGFAGTVANVGKTFGMADDEAVRLATRMAVFSRSRAPEALKAFTAMGMQAAELKVPMDALTDPMMILAELAGRTGHNVQEASTGLYSMIQAVNGLKNSGIAMFKGMTGADVSKVTKEFASFVSGMDEMQLAAMTFNRNEGFEKMSERVSSLGTKGRVDAIKQMMNDYELQGPDKKAQLGFMLGAKNFSEAVSRGSIAQDVSSQGMNDNEYNKRMAANINSQLAERKTAGEAIQFGLDPTAFMMDRVQQILNVLETIQRTIAFWTPKGATADANKMVTATAASAKSTYGSGPIKRSYASVPIGPGGK